ncbi:MAG: signal transduction histidine kinase, partial [Candidatus Krumholzibacteriota bacterium]|nr:signal transduction histidine kinase [Candidatus Krumholzibacteriota bacterium]
LCAGVAASAISHRRSRERVGRLDDFVQEMSCCLVRERERSRIGERSIEYHMRLSGDLNRLRVILGGDPEPAGVAELSETIDTMQRYSEAYWDEVLADKASYAMTDLVELARRAAEKWRVEAQKRGVQLTVHFPDEEASLLLDRDKVSDALDKIFTTTLSCLGEGDKAFVECSLCDDRALVCIADNGAGLPGDIVSRLFMPFVDAADDADGQRALSLAGDILQKHSAEILIKSSASWRTILVLSFPLAACRDRRKRGADRRGRRERRVTRHEIRR